MNIRKKINADDLLLGIVVALTILMLLIVSSYFFKKNEMDKLTNGLYSSTNFRFSMKESEGNNSLHKFIKQTKQSNYILFKENIEKPNIRGVYSSQTLNTIPMKSGRFFQKEDFFHNKKLAVVGKEFKDIENISGKKFVNYKGHKFEVIGTIGGEVKSEVDNIIYLNLDALWDLNINSTGIYVIDGNDDGEKLFSTLESILGKDSVFPIEDKGKGSKRLFENNFIDNSMIFLLFIIALMMNILSTSYWIYKKRILISIQHFIGHKSFYIYRSLYYKYIFISICSYSIGFVLFLIFNIKLYNDHIYTYNKLFFIGILFMLIFTIGICIVSSCIYTKKNCIKVLKSN
ncbi:ABC transporter permease [Bacillus cereus]|uniref:ABC3 transporter permease C-terminal domain-containing protein n=1 Tax=Bacillus cereus TaxID=1396 RepID=A0A2A7HSU3_BACCE|nr:ABC transporter permease [Bacillus cereus]PEC19913.1 hypothetical protein COM96_22230 [Bacillus cereus]